MSEIEFRDPAPTIVRKARKNWDAIADALRAHPGAWAVIDTDVASATAFAYRSGRNAAFPKGEFEFTARGNKGGRAAELFGRYVGTEQ